MKHVPPPTGTPIAGPQPTQDSLIARLAKQARKRERALVRLRELRKRASDEIERLLEFLDASDLDPDLEETADDEPSLGWPATGQCGSIDDLEQEDGNDEPDSDGEPSLGSVGDLHFNQERWATGDRRDLEDQHDGAEPDVDDEPSLGSFDRLANQEHSWTARVDGWNVGNDTEVQNHGSIRQEPKPPRSATPILGAEWKIEKVE